MINTAIAQIKSRRLFYRGYYLKGLNLLIALLIIELVLMTGVFYGAMHRAIPAFYASSTDGQLSLLRPMLTPNFSNKPLLN